MNIWCFLQAIFLQTLFNKTLGRVLVLKSKQKIKAWPSDWESRPNVSKGDMIYDTYLDKNSKYGHFSRSDMDHPFNRHHFLLEVPQVSTRDKIQSCNCPYNFDVSLNFFTNCRFQVLQFLFNWITLLVLYHLLDTCDMCMDPYFSKTTHILLN